MGFPARDDAAVVQQRVSPGAGGDATPPGDDAHMRSLLDAAIRPDLHDLPVQRRAGAADGEHAERGDDTARVHQAAATGISGGGGPLPFLDTIQRSFGHHSVADVQAHTDGAARTGARAMGAEAFATGNHVAFAEAPTLHVAAHEAAHVVQQAGGVHLSGGVGQADDRYERHADAVADRVVRGESAEALLDEHSGAGGGAVARPPGGVQRSLKIGPRLGANDITGAFKNQDPTQPQRTAVDFAQDVANTMAAELGADSPILQELRDNIDAVSVQLVEWIEDEAGTMEAKSHPVYGREKQDRHYANHTELAKGLLGWVKAAQNREREKQLAAHVYQNGVLDVYFSSLLHKAALKIHNLHLIDANVDQARRDDIVNELTTGQSVVAGHEGQEIGHYRHFFDHHPKGDAVKTNIVHGNMFHVLQAGAGYDVKNKVVVFHDLMEYFGNPRNWITPGRGEGLLPEPGLDKSRSTTAIDAHGNRTAHSNDRGMAWPPSFNNATRNENEAGTQLARQHDIPLWAGQSMTTVRVENLAEWIGASKEEKTALAWAIFAFWHIDYDHTSQWAYHTLHETMDMAANFGVDYNMLDREASLATFTPDALKADMRTKWVGLRANALQAAAAFGALDGADPVRGSVDEKLRNVNQALVDANQAFQAAGPLPQDQQIAASHQIMKHLNWCELNCNMARRELGL